MMVNMARTESDVFVEENFRRLPWWVTADRIERGCLCTKPLRGSLPIVRLTWAAHAERMAAPDHRIELCGYNRPERRRPCSNPFYPKSCPTSS